MFCGFFVNLHQLHLNDLYCIIYYQSKNYSKIACNNRKIGQKM